MITQLTINEVLNRAIEKEIVSQFLYSGLKHRVKDQAAKDILDLLVKQEKKHEIILHDYVKGALTGGALCPGDAVDYKIAENLDQPEINPEMALKDIFTMAARREKAANEFYLGLAGAHPPGHVRNLLEELACQELEHKQRMETLYTEVAFPQTDGG